MGDKDFTITNERSSSCTLPNLLISTLILPRTVPWRRDSTSMVLEAFRVHAISRDKVRIRARSSAGVASSSDGEDQDVCLLVDQGARRRRHS